MFQSIVAKLLLVCALAPGDTSGQSSSLQQSISPSPPANTGDRRPLHVCLNTTTGLGEVVTVLENECFQITTLLCVYNLPVLARAQGMLTYA
jgi:hypothetical protein